MNNSDLLLLELVTRLTYNIDGLSNELKFYFSQFLTFHFSKRLSVNQIQNVENKKASLRFKSNEEILTAAASIPVNDRIWAIAAIKLLQSQAERVDDRIVSRRIGLLLTDLILMLDLEKKEKEIAGEKKRIEDEIYQFQNRTTIKIPARIWPLTLDYLVRWAMLLSFNYLGLNKDMLTGLNTFLIPISILVLVAIAGGSHRRKNRRLLNQYGDPQQFNVEYYFTTSQYTWLAFFLGTSVFVSYLLPDQLHMLAIIGFLMYYFMYLRFFRIGRINENDLVKQLEAKRIDTTTLNVDENDEYIVGLETKLNSSTSRLEAYVLESALFGALSFSGFLQIMATDLVSFKDLEDFASYIFTSAQAFIHFDWIQFNTGIAGLSSKVSLFCLVSLESLVCSIFFLAVIASRLRFSDIVDKVRTSINLAKTYNAKEEAFVDEKASGAPSERLAALTRKVNEQLHEATAILEEISPVMTYMEYFRNAGILVFLIILISSSLFITGILGWTFLVLVLATYFYFNRTTVNNKIKSLFLVFRIQFIRLGYLFFGLALFPQILAYVLRIAFHIRETNFLIALSYFLTALYVFAWLLLAAHVDEQFGEIEGKRTLETRQSRWRFIKITMAILVLLFGIAMALKTLRLMGANEMVLISLQALAILMYFVGYYLTKVRWLGIVCGGVIAIAGIGILFKVLHLNGANEMIFVAICAFLILIPVVLLKRKLFHRLLLRFCLAGFLISFWYSPLSNGLPIRLELAYEHESWRISQLLPVFEEELSVMVHENGAKVLDQRIEESDRYQKQYGTQFGFTIVYRMLASNFQSFASEALMNKTTPHKLDTTLLSLALKAAQAENKIIYSFNGDVPSFVDLKIESDVLIAMGKKEEAIASLNKMLLLNINDDRKPEIKNRIKEIAE